MDFTAAITVSFLAFFLSFIILPFRYLFLQKGMKNVDLKWLPESATWQLSQL